MAIGSQFAYWLETEFQDCPNDMSSNLPRPPVPDPPIRKCGMKRSVSLFSGAMGFGPGLEGTGLDISGPAAIQGPSGQASQFQPGKSRSRHLRGNCPRQCLKTLEVIPESAEPTLSLQKARKEFFEETSPIISIHSKAPR